MKLLDLLLHLDTSLQSIVGAYPLLTYGLLFLIIFLETGVVITPFLPGDSLLFVAGALAATGAFHIGILFILLLAAAILGDTVNYHIGRYIGPKIFKRQSSMLFRKEYILRAEAFYSKHGRKTIILARFIPIIRTFAPFVAGIGKMPYSVFLLFNIIGAVAWCGLFLFGGFFFGNIQWIKEHFGIFVLVIIFISCLPVLKGLVSYGMARFKKRARAKA